MFKKIASIPIYGYRYLVRPFLPNSCVFYAHGKQSCSEYTLSMIATKGVLWGWFYGIGRIIRCHAWQKNFNDPQ